MAIEDEVRRLVDEQMERLLKPYRAAMENLASAASDFASMATGAWKAARKGKGLRRAVAGRRAEAGTRPCAIIGCPRPSRSKGYCSAHYQKRRNMQKAGRLPKEWVDNAGAATVADVKVPRGRAASKARKAKA